ncbi:MAG: methyltransferase domain-containing protein [Chloroflexi bacterium]|nr:methyltransferase domain-containing protein [Chloroflexota bacterium]
MGRTPAVSSLDPWPTDDTRPDAEAWNAVAAWWDERVGDEGNEFHRVLVGSATERLLQLQPGELVLDVACGNGQFSRRLAALGARVVAFDLSEAFIRRAGFRSEQYRDAIEYLVLDATEREALRGLGRARFDAAVSCMALMDIRDLDPLFAALRELLKPRGRFVFSVNHPAFATPHAKRLTEFDDTTGEEAYSWKIRDYITPQAHEGVGIVGQPRPQTYFHRPLHLLLESAFHNGFVLDGLEEPVYELPSETGRRPWSLLTGVPQALVCRLQLR